MPDISMCSNRECESRIHCYRYRAKSSNWQSYLVMEGPMIRCDHYWSTSGYDDRRITPMIELEPPTPESGSEEKT